MWLNTANFHKGSLSLLEKNEILLQIHYLTFSDFCYFFVFLSYHLTIFSFIFKFYVIISYKQYTKKNQFEDL
jgi:hypothetical protein